MRRLFRGEAIVGHDGPAGSWPVLFLDERLDEYLPMSVVAFGPETPQVGAVGASTRSFCTPTSPTTTTACCVQTVKRAVTEELAVIPLRGQGVVMLRHRRQDHISEDRRLMKTVGRLARPTCRPTGSSSSAQTAGIRMCSFDSLLTPLCRPVVALTSSARPNSWSTSPP